MDTLLFPLLGQVPLLVFHLILCLPSAFPIPFHYAAHHFSPHNHRLCWLYCLLHLWTKYQAKITSIWQHHMYVLYTPTRLTTCYVVCQCCIYKFTSMDWDNSIITHYWWIQQQHTLCKSMLYFTDGWTRLYIIRVKGGLNVMLHWSILNMLWIDSAQ